MTDRGSATTTAPGDWKKSVARDTGGLARGGYIAFAVALGIFVLWAAAFPLSSAVVAQGELVATGQNKLLQHRTGGVVRSIAVRNGDQLAEDDLVIAIEPIEAAAELKRLRAAQNLLLAKRARLEAESPSDKLAGNLAGSNGLRGAIVPVSASGREVNRIFAEQETEMIAREAQFQSEISALRNQLENLQSERTGIASRVGNQVRLSELLADQEQRMIPLAEAGYIAKVKLWEVQSRKLETDSRLADLEARLGSLSAREAEISDRIATLDSGKSADDAKELSSVLAELAAISGELEAAEEAVSDTEIRAPVAGRLTNLTANTVGGVIRPGETIGEIVPVSEPYHVEARIAPADIGAVNPGQDAQIIITALNRRLDDPLSAQVSYIAADSVTDENTGEIFFPVHLVFNGSTDNLPALQSGMIAETYIEVEGRTFFAYALEPLSDSFRRAFRER